MDIAMHSGPVVRKMTRDHPHPGRAQEVKRLSRLASGGTVTISEGLAGRVVRGELDHRRGVREAEETEKAGKVSEMEMRTVIALAGVLPHAGAARPAGRGGIAR